MKQQLLMKENKDLRKCIALGIQQDDAFTGLKWLTEVGSLPMIRKSFFDPSEGDDGRVNAYLESSPGMAVVAEIHGHVIICHKDDLG